MKGVLEQKRHNLLEKSRSLSVDIPTRELQTGGGKNAKDRDNSRAQYVRAYDEFLDMAGQVFLDVAPSYPCHRY
ncbi:hypothetical protein ID866_13130 [Astraeus odoratus]|nr:hypothetical protein ID866_13130 [Astraeus odoratus]